MLTFYLIQFQDFEHLDTLQTADNTFPRLKPFVCSLKFEVNPEVLLSLLRRQGGEGIFMENRLFGLKKIELLNLSAEFIASQRSNKHQQSPLYYTIRKCSKVQNFQNRKTVLKVYLKVWRFLERILKMSGCLLKNCIRRLLDSIFREQD